MRAFLSALFSLAFLSGCAEARLRPGGVEAAAGPVVTKFKSLNPGQRAEIYAKYRLTWDGRHVVAGGDTLTPKQLLEFLERSGAGDLASAASKAEPAFVREERRKGKSPKGVGGDVGNWGSWNAPGDGKTAAAILAVGAAVALVTGAVIAGQAIVEGVWSDLNPEPTIEDVLEAFNQRLAYALGLEYQRASVYTSMPRYDGKPEFTARGQRHGEYVVKGSLGACLAAMGASSAMAFYEASQGRDAPNWTWPTFFASAGAGLATLIVGWTIVW